MADPPILNNSVWQEHVGPIESTVITKGGLNNKSVRLIMREANEYALRIQGNDAPLSFNYPMHSHPMTDIGCNDDLQLLAATAIRAAPVFKKSTAKGNYDKLVSLWTSANSLKELHRFASSRQPKLARIPLPDGSNLEDFHINPQRPHELICEWAFYRCWIRVLHFGGFDQYEHSIKGSGLNARPLFITLYRLGRLLLEVELNQIKPDPEDNFATYYSQSLPWMEQSRSIVREVLEGVAAIAFEPQPRLGPRPQTAQPEPQMTRDEIFEHNMHPDRASRVFDSMLKKYEELMANNPLERLIMDLLRLENKFELSLTAEHIEDKLLNKQIIQHNETKLLQRENVSPYAVIDSYMDKNRFTVMDSELVNVLARDGALLHRHRHNFRLMRDWTGLRPWWKIFQLYDTSTAETNWLQRAITEFVDHGLREEYTADFICPSDMKNKAFHYFGFHPLDYSKPDTKEKYQGCALCAKEYVGSNTHDSSIAVLHCTSKHHFHLGCIFKYWDQEGNYMRECPECGEAPELNHIVVGIRKNHDSLFFDSADPSFAHNTFEYKPRDTVWNTMAPTPENSETLYRARKNFYNIPPRPVAGVPQAGRRPRASDGEHRLYWLRENMHAACFEAAPLKWEAEMLSPYSFMERGGERPTLFQQGWNRRVKGLKERWLAMRNDTGPRDFSDGVLSYDAARFPTASEAALLRHHRRRRDRNRRQRIRAAGAGLGGLGGTFL